jgi:uncharacterized membrane protein (DUF373 family)
MKKRPWFDPLRYDLTRFDLFERGMSAVLLAGMSVVIVLAAVSFFVTIGQEMGQLGTHVGYNTFQRLFDSALAVLIAIELAHSVLQSVRGHHGLVQVRTVVVIGVLAIVRKFVLLEIETANGMLVLGLAAALLALGAVYGVTHWIEDRMRSRKREDEEAEENLSEKAGVPTSDTAA